MSERQREIEAELTEARDNNGGSGATAGVRWFKLWPARPARLSVLLIPLVAA